MRVTGAVSSVTTGDSSSGTPWCSRPPAASRPSTPPTKGLVFGRLDLSENVPGGEAPRYIGRIGLRDEHRDSLLIDWRAPAAAVFYQATAADPQGVVRRRVLRCTGPKVVGVEDDLLDSEEGDRPRRGRRGRAAGAALARPRPHHALDRRHHPGRAGPGDPGAQQGRRVDLRRPRHRQDRRRAAPRGVPPLLRPSPLRERRRARRRALGGVHALHRARAALARRDRGRAAVARRGRRRHQVVPPRRPGRRRREGCRAHGRAAASYGATGRARRASRAAGVLPRRQPRARPARAQPDPSAAAVAEQAQPPGAARRFGAARRDVAAGAGRAWPRARPRRVQRRHARHRRVRRLRARVVAAARRDRGARLAARPRPARPGRRGRAERRRAGAAVEVVGTGARARALPGAARRLDRRGRATDRRAPLRARGRSREAGERPRRRVRPGRGAVRRERPGAHHDR